MRYRMFGGRRAAVVALGSTDFGGKFPEGQCIDFMDAYESIGGNFLDTARIYGDFAGKRQGESEKIIGRWLEKRDRGAFFISTKGGHPDPEHMDVGRLSRAEVWDDFRRSLENLRTDRVDIYWLHRDDLSRPVGDILETLNLFVEKGQARLLGASNWTAARIAEANAYAEAHGMAGFAANQPQFSLARQDVVEDDTLVQMDAETYAFHAKTGLPCVCFSSQAKGFFTKLHDSGEAALSDKARRRFATPENLAIYERLCAMSAETGYSVNALALAYLTCQPFDTYPITGASRIEQVLALREAGDAVLTEEQVKKLRVV